MFVSARFSAQCTEYWLTPEIKPVKPGFLPAHKPGFMGLKMGGLPGFSGTRVPFPSSDQKGRRINVMKKNKITTHKKVRCVGTHPSLWHFELTRVKPNKIAYTAEVGHMAALLTDIVFNQLHQYRYVNSPVISTYCYAELTISSQWWPIPFPELIIMPTHGGIARLSWYTSEQSPISVLTWLDVQQLRWCTNDVMTKPNHH